MTDDRDRISRRRFLAGTTAGIAAVAGCTSGGSSGYPSENITYIVPFSQGGGTDTYARKIMPELSKELGVGIAVQNVPGAASLKGTGKLLRSEPNGYTFGGFNPPSTPLSYLVLDPGWDITKLVPVCTYARTPYCIFARPEHKIKGMKDLVNRYQNDGLSKFGGLGRGGIVHVAANVMKSEYGLTYDQYVGYDGAGPALKAAISGEVPVVATTDTAALSAVKSGDLEPVAVLSSDGSNVFSNVPSPSDAGYPSIDYIGQLIRCMFLPPNTETSRRDTLEKGVKAALQHDSVQQWSKQTGNIVAFGNHKKAKQALQKPLEKIPKKINLDKITQ
jgi:tripartite-type tricarboxylate transporter receptor subunit TctC